MVLTFVRRVVLAATVLLGALAVAAAAAEMREHRIPLENNRTTADRLLGTVGRELGLPNLPAIGTEIDLAGDRGPAFCRQLNDALWPACTAAIDGGALTVKLDRAALPSDAAAVRRTARLLASGSATRPPDRYGLVVPDKYDPARPLVLLIHGLDSDNAMWGSMVNLLQADGHQVGCFTYPDDGPIAESGHLLADAMADLRLKHPAAKPAMVVAHSMGGLVARHYVEGPAFRGGIDRLVMLGTPNHGSAWTGWRWATEWHSQYKTCQREGNWTWSRLTADGNGEAARDMQPGSEFLKALNARPRRAGVRYTAVAGDRSAFREVGAQWVACTADWFPQRTTGWWGFRHAHEGLVNKAKEMHQTPAASAGPVAVESCKLAGVDDFVVVSADHTALACGHPPAAWPVIQARLR